MFSKKASREDIPASNNNNLYYVDNSLAQFAKNYEPPKVESNTSARVVNTNSKNSNNTQGSDS